MSLIDYVKTEKEATTFKRPDQKYKKSKSLMRRNITYPIDCLKLKRITYKKNKYKTKRVDVVNEGNCNVGLCDVHEFKLYHYGLHDSMFKFIADRYNLCKKTRTLSHKHSNDINIQDFRRV